MGNILYDIWFSEIKNIGCTAGRTLLEIYGSAENIYKAPETELKDCLYSIFPGGERGFNTAASKLLCKNTGAAEKILNKAAEKHISIISINSERYPYFLKEISDAPPVLYAKGKLDLLKEPGIAIVGTRRASSYGKWVATELGKRIARCGVTVVSGMAEGIDSFGHRACLEAQGNTIAVFGTGVDVCYPVSKERLYADIEKNGLIVSEYAPGTLAQAYHFPARNRIISGLSRKVIVVEGAARSGSLITAGLAAEQNREVYAVPGNINQPNSIGTNMLIMEGAIPLMDIESAVETLGIGQLRLRKEVSGLNAHQQHLYAIIRQSGTISLESLIAQAECPAESVLPSLTMLEIKKLVKREGNFVMSL